MSGFSGKGSVQTSIKLNLLNIRTDAKGIQADKVGLKVDFKGDANATGDVIIANGKYEIDLDFNLEIQGTNLQAGDNFAAEGLTVDVTFNSNGESGANVPSPDVADSLTSVLETVGRMLMVYMATKSQDTSATDTPASSDFDPSTFEADSATPDLDSVDFAELNRDIDAELGDLSDNLWGDGDFSQFDQLQ